MSDRPERDSRAANRGLANSKFDVDVTRKLPDAGGGLPAFVATGLEPPGEPLMALLVGRHAPARPRLLAALTRPIDRLLTPLAHGPGPPVNNQAGWYVVCRAPPGPSVATLPRVWSESALIDMVLRPFALILEELNGLGLTHRGIRPNNVFHGQPDGQLNRPLILGAAWAAPPAMHQPAQFETPYTALCHPAARGRGSIADDVYALGVLLVTLALGRVPMAGADERTIIAKKLELGDFNAIAGGERLPPMLTDLVRGMLAEDPEHRPPPSLLRDPSSARGRKVAARPASRAQKGFVLGGMTVWNSRGLAMAMAIDPGAALAAIQAGTLMHWMRRSLGNSGLAVKLEELVRLHAPDLGADTGPAAAALMMRAVMDIDAFMPLCWRGFAIFPEGLGPALAAASDPSEKGSDLSAKLREIVANEVQGLWAVMRQEHTPPAPLRLEAKQRRAILEINGPAGGLPRLSYTLNPLIPCASPLLEGRWISNIQELVPALDSVAAAAPNTDLLDPQIAAFVGARSERWLDREVKALAIGTDNSELAFAQLRLLCEMQKRYFPAALKGLTAWIAARAQPLVERWNNRERRASVAEKLKTLTARGFLEPILQLLEDPPGHESDTEGLRIAIADLHRLDTELRVIAAGGKTRSAIALRIGQELAAGAGVAVIASTLILTALG